MANTIQLKDSTGTIIYPVTKTTAVFDNNGTSIDDKYINAKDPNNYVKVVNDAQTGNGLSFITVADNIMRGKVSAWIDAGWNQASIRAGNSNYIGEFKIMRPDDGSGDLVMQVHKYDNGSWTYLGNVDASLFGANYIRYTNGLQIAWGVNAFNSSGVRVNYEQPFSPATNRVIVAPLGGAATNLCATTATHDATGFYGYCTLNYNCAWIAIGRWK